jgi:regulator of RNase E activity RraA
MYRQSEADLIESELTTLHRPSGIDETLWAECLRVDTSCVSDVLNARGTFNKAMRPGIRGAAADARLVGIARTMRSRPRETAPDAGREYALLFEAIDGLGAGEVLVTDEMGCCVWGELCCERALVRTANGTIIDGYHRDTSRVVASGLPVFSRGAHPSDMLYHREIVAINEPVHCGGVFVSPGDLLIADADGIVAVPAGMIAEVIGEAVGKIELETKVRNALRAGDTAAQAFEKFGVF